MSGFFGVVSTDDCVADLFYGTDYHSHLGTRRGGLAVRREGQFHRFIHDITNAQFRSKFETDITRLRGSLGIGVISDYEDQPLIIGSHLGTYAIVTVGVVRNAAELSRRAFGSRTTHFSEMSGTEINPTEIVATLINQEDSFVNGIRAAQEQIEGSCSIMLLTDQGIYAARDRYGRTPVIIGKGPRGHAVTMETTAFPNLGYEVSRVLGPGETVLLTPDGAETILPAGPLLQICTFLYVYYGYPASSYEGLNVEASRYRSGRALASRDDVVPDFVAGIPDSGTAHGLGYAEAARIPYRRPFVKYTPTWPRSFMPQDQTVRDLVARMKLVPIRELTEGARILFCDDSIVRGTQLRDTLERIYAYGAKEIHLRLACPPLLYGCSFLNFSRSKSEFDLAARKAVAQLEPGGAPDLAAYADPDSPRYAAMIEIIRERMNLTTLRYQRLDDLVAAIGLPREKLCTYCWDGCDPTGKGCRGRACEGEPT